MKRINVLVVLALVALPVALFAASNTVQITMPDGKIITMPVSDSLEAMWARWGGIIFGFVAVARVILAFLPAAGQSGSGLSKLVGFLKQVSLAIPDKHTDVKALPPVTNIAPGINDIGQTDIGRVDIHV